MIVNVLFEHDDRGNPHGCSHIRLLRPLAYPTLKNRLKMLASRDLAAERADVVVVERWWLPACDEAQAHRLVRDVRARGSTLIYTLDDNLLDIDLDEEGSAVTEVRKRITRYFIREADGVIVSTPALAQRLSHLNSRIRVVPNALDEQLFLTDGFDPLLSPPRPAEAPVVLGYMGTLTHAADLALMIGPLRKLMARYGARVQLEIIGVSQNVNRMQALFGNRVRMLDPGDAVHYEQFAHWFSRNAHWDIGLAPLTDRAFNRCKSDIKFLDYGILGIPGIFSRVGPYADSVVHEQNGLLVDNAPQDWYAALSRLVDDPSLRQRLGRGAAEYVRSQRVLNVRATDWLAAIEALHNQALVTHQNERS